ncbi:retromer subunit VPS35 [Saccharomyces paradoxus]|uniref:Vacuolar protein sorting-associated protein 35 n=1 Tax=Saccharomyces paradoxus TaxID=27291 RepID=A0A8B8UTN4_SACPA|nr:Vps35 [Saccharomyces paradoxus]QHS74108.1 Vps35 [Saccharomyces paradoxus]
MAYADSPENAIAVIKQRTALMNRCLSQHKLMESLQHTSIMLTELRNPNLSPKKYYELYVIIFDSLTNLSTYLIENHPQNHHLADLYELVQYTGNVVPRLYLMITVGTSYLTFNDAPKKEILKDMIEMCRGVQNPIRGLFLRYYLSQRTKELLPEDDPSFNSQFIMNNFIEMNKLWVRLQHQGPLRERETRTRERKELQILVGSQLVRLSQIIDDNFQMYKQDVLPTILEQVIQCRDLVSQEYLLDVICQVFTDEFHLKTLDALLQTTLHLNPDVSINKIVLTLVDRLNDYVTRQLEDNPDATSTNAYLDMDVFGTFWDYLTVLNHERPDLSLQQFIPLVESVIVLSLKWYPNNFENLNKLFELVLQKTKDYGQKNISLESEHLFLVLLSFQNSKLQLTSPSTASSNSLVTSKKNFIFQLISQCQAYKNILALQSIGLQKKVVNEIIDILMDKDVEELADNESESKLHLSEHHTYLVIEDKLQVQRLLSICEPLIISRSGPPANVASSDTNIDEVFFNRHDEEESWILDPIQAKLALLIHWIMNTTSRKQTTKNKFQFSLEAQLEILLLIKSSFIKGGINVKYTFPAIITNFWKLIRKCHMIQEYLLKKRPDNKTLSSHYSNLLKQMFKFVSRCINDIFNSCNNSCTDLILKLNLQCATLADQLQLNEISYDFFSQAFTIFEESLSDSKTQLQALIYMAQSLQKTRSLYKEAYYDSLIVRCTLHGSKLLKKQDQCRAVYLCSHLWWATEISNIGEEEGITDNFHRDGKRVLECLQRSLRVADSIMDNEQSCELMVEILNRCLYYFIHGDETETHISIKYINGLIELIKTNLKSLKLEDNSASMITNTISDLHITGENNVKSNTNADDGSVTVDKDSNVAIGSDGTYIQLNTLNGSSTLIHGVVATASGSKLLHQLKYVPIYHFQRTCEYIESQREVDDRFKVIYV